MSPDGLFDRLAMPQTRARALRSALAALGALGALTLPLARTQVARAAGPHDCQKGCLWTANGAYHDAWQRCDSALRKPVALGGIFGLWGGGLVTVAAGALGGAIAQAACKDRAVLDARSASYDCTLPDCPGFDPTAPGGPCEDCHQSCCPCEASTSGYICCVYACDDPQHHCCPA